MKEADDMAEPSPNSISALNLLRIGYMLDENDPRQRAEQTIAAFASQLEHAPSSMPQMLVALSWCARNRSRSSSPAKWIDPATKAILHVVHEHFVPHEILILADGRAGQEFFRNASSS